MEEALEGIVEQAAGGITSGGLEDSAIKRAALGHCGKLEAICTEGWNYRRRSSAICQILGG